MSGQSSRRAASAAIPAISIATSNPGARVGIGEAPQEKSPRRRMPSGALAVRGQNLIVACRATLRGGATKEP
jgi:hypothetical protein